jgi:L-rhamnose mutarotase
MKSYAQTLLLRDDPAKIEEYIRYHAAVWPEVLAQIRAAGIERMQIFLLGRRLFMYIDTADDFEPERDFPKTMDHPKSQEWNKLMGELQERAPEARPDQWWAPMERVFDTEWPQHKPS